MVLIEKKPAAVMGDMHTCPQVNPGPPAIPHVGGPIIATAAMVLIGGKPAARVGDMATCTGPPDSVVAGCPTVLIGDAGGSGGAGAGSGGKQKVKVVEAASEVEENHYLDVKFVDKGGKPISGIKYEVKTPDDKTYAGTLTGRVKKSGLQEGDYEISLMAITIADWSTKKAKAGETVTLTAETSGIKDGEKAVFQITIRDANFADRRLAAIEAKVSGNKAEAKWKLEVDDNLIKIQADKEQIGRFSSPMFFFTAEIGELQARSPMLWVVDDLEFRLTDEDGQPIKDRSFQAFLSNGEVKSGTLDGDGKAKLEGVPPGQVRVKVDVRGNS
jgi:uncharacterized Zn-binding protein involved in type VI secretion